MALPLASPISGFAPETAAAPRVLGAGQAAKPLACSHCSAPVGCSPIRIEDSVFCCAGCQTAHALSTELRSACPVAKRATPASGSSQYDYFDDPAFLKPIVRIDSSGLSHATLSLRGMRCASCVWTVEEMPRKVPGVIEARVDFRRGRVALTWSSDEVKLSAIAQRLADLGYTPAPLGHTTDESANRAEDRRQMARLAVAGACAGNAMLLAVALYAGVFDGMAPEFVAIFRWASLFVTIGSLAWPGQVFFRSAWTALRARSINLDGPIALALLAGGAWSIYSTIIGKGEIYFDSVSVLIFALLVGRYIQHRQQRWAADSVELLFTLTPGVAHRVIPGDGAQNSRTERVPVLSLVTGDVVEVLPGDSIPVDGVVVDGESSIDQSLLTGESQPRTHHAGDEVFAGSVNLSGVIRIRTLASGASTRIGKLMELVQEASGRRARIVRFADRVGGVFMTLMLIVAALTFLVWLPLGLAHAIETAVAVLVVTCPCALGLATPLAFTIVIGRAARRGILIKGGDAVQHLSGTGVLYLDKTGTLTHGTMNVVGWTGPDHLRAIVAHLESNSTHPVGRALAAISDSTCQPDTLAITNVQHLPGRGVTANYHNDTLRIGSPTYILSEYVTCGPEFAAFAQQHASEGLTPVLIAIGQTVVAAAAIGDTLRPNAPATVARLQSLGWDCRIISGDDERAVAAAAKQCGIATFQGGLNPEQKLAIIDRSRQEATTVMVGDGVNDSAALAAADVGIAVHGGAQASLAAADLYLSRPGLTPLLEVVLASRRTLCVVKLALASSVIYNLVAGTIAVTGHMNPIIAALVMPLSSITSLSLCVAVRSFGKVPKGGVE